MGGQPYYVRTKDDNFSYVDILYKVLKILNPQMSKYPVIDLYYKTIWIQFSALFFKEECIKSIYRTSAWYKILERYPNFSTVPCL